MRWCGLVYNSDGGGLLSPQTCCCSRVLSPSLSLMAYHDEGRQIASTLISSESHIAQGNSRGNSQGSSRCEFGTEELAEFPDNLCSSGQHKTGLGGHLSSDPHLQRQVCGHCIRIFHRQGS